MKTDVEELSQTRVRLTVEVPFEELKASLDKAYREVSRQIRVPGFRPGHVPPRVIDQRIGRSAVLEQAVNDVVPELYGKALDEHEVVALGQPELEITKLDDGKELTFTAEVDIRPAFDLPDIDGMAVTVDDAEVTPDEVEEYLSSLRERFASLRGVERAAQPGDFVSIDLSAHVDGKPVPDAEASGISYEVGSASMLDGLDEAVDGMSAGENATFTAQLAGGAFAGREAQIAVTVNSVKVKEMPDLDDDFAQLASEFDTLGELRASTRTQLEQMRRIGQAGQARERALDALMERVDFPLPDGVIARETDERRRGLDERLQRAGSTMDSYLESTGLTEDGLSQQIAEDARRSVKAGFLLDKLAVQEEITVEPADLSAYITEQAYRYGMTPDRMAKELTDNGQLPAVAADVRRTKALALLAARARVTDETGRPVEVTPQPGEAVAEDDEAQDAAGQGEDTGGQLPDAGQQTGQEADASDEDAAGQGQGAGPGEHEAAESAGQAVAAAKPKGRSRRSRA